MTLDQTEKTAERTLQQHAVAPTKHPQLSQIHRYQRQSDIGGSLLVLTVKNIGRLVLDSVTPHRRVP